MGTLTTTPKKEVHRKLHCEHVRCGGITTHRLKFHKNVYDDVKKEFNTLFYRTCVVCESRNPKAENTMMDIIGSSDWAVLMARPDII